MKFSKTGHLMLDLGVARVVMRLALYGYIDPVTVRLGEITGPVCFDGTVTLGFPLTKDCVVPQAQRYVAILREKPGGFVDTCEREGCYSEVCEAYVWGTLGPAAPIFVAVGMECTSPTAPDLHVMFPGAYWNGLGPWLTEREYAFENLGAGLGKCKLDAIQSVPLAITVAKCQNECSFNPNCVYVAHSATSCKVYADVPCDVSQLDGDATFTTYRR
jgi:hypothetical protein